MDECPQGEEGRGGRGRTCGSHVGERRGRGEREGRVRRNGTDRWKRESWDREPCEVRGRGGRGELYEERGEGKLQEGELYGVEGRERESHIRG